MDEDRFAYSELSLRSAAGLPNQRLASSRAAGWTSLLLERHGSAGRGEAFDVSPTPDQTIVVALRDDHDLEVWRAGGWRRAVKRAGAISATAPGETCRLRWSSRQEAGFETAHLYIPGAIITETVEHYRRAGQRVRPHALTALAERDPLLQQAVAGLLGAMAAGAPDLYAETASRWIANHMLCRDGRVERDWAALGAPGVLGDRRLARVLEFMGAHLGDRLSLASLAAEAHVSKFHFARLFRLQTGRSPARYLADLRMDAACRLLETSALPVAAVASACGYERAGNFSTAFLRRFGMTPSAYRRRHHGSRT